MPQVLKPEIRARIRDAALRTFAERGFMRSTMTEVAGRAGTSTANVYRYYPSKDALFSDVVPDELVDELERIVGNRLHTFATLLDQDELADDVAEEMMAFWLSHRLESVIVLAGAEGTRHEQAAPHLVELSVATLVGALPARCVGRGEHVLVESIFENTARTLARLLFQDDDPTTLRGNITSFWHYQLGGLTALLRHLAD